MFYLLEPLVGATRVPRASLLLYVCCPECRTHIDL
jgi:hypothetical protein